MARSAAYVQHLAGITAAPMSGSAALSGQPADTRESKGRKQATEGHKTTSDTAPPCTCTQQATHHTDNHKQAIAAAAAASHFVRARRAKAEALPLRLPAHQPPMPTHPCYTRGRSHRTGNAHIQRLRGRAGVAMAPRTPTAALLLQRESRRPPAGSCCAAFDARARNGAHSCRNTRGRRA